MPRRKRQFEKNWAPDDQYDNALVGRFIGMLMRDGKRAVAMRVLYDAIDLIGNRTKQPGISIFEQAIKNVAPLVQLKSRRVGGANYQVPMPVAGDRRNTLALRWIRDAARGKKGAPMASRLADEIIAASNKEGAAMKKREETHRMAEANKAFAHFAS